MDSENTNAAEQTTTPEPIDADVMARASEMGFSESQVREFGPKAVLAMAEAFDRKMVVRQPVQTDNATKKDDPLPSDEDDNDWKIELPSDDEALDPKITAATRDVVAAAKKGVKKAMDRASAAEKRVAAMEQRLAAEQMHKNKTQFEDIAKEVDSELFGTKRYYELDEHDPVIAARARLWDAFVTMHESRKSRGLPPLSDSELMRRAYRAEFAEEIEGKKKQARTQEAVESKLEEREKQIIAKPDQRDGKPTTAADKDAELARRAEAILQGRR